MTITISKPLQQAPQVRVPFLPQDTMISKPEDILLPARDMGTQLRGPRFRTVDSQPIAKADAQGNYSAQVGTPQFDQINAHATVAATTLTYERYCGRTLKWSFPGPLEIKPHAGEGKTAYYARWNRGLSFCQWDSPSLGKVVKTAESFDVGSHEAGHAILDGMRPGLLGSNESKAFHEAFGDCSALIHALQYDTNLEKILAENGGDFSKPSLITRLAEEFGTAFNKEDDNPNNDDRPYYRTALNDFKYAPIDSLPSDTYPPSQPEEVLTSEPHSFGRIWSGAFYSMLKGLYEQESQAGHEPMLALKNAREALGFIWGGSLEQLPAANLKFKQPAAAMLREAREYEGGKYFDSLAAVMLDRNLLTEQEISNLGGKISVNSALNWEADPVQEGRDGRQILTFRASHPIEVDLGDMGRAQLNVYSGLTRVVDAQGQLLHEVYTPISEADVRRAQIEAKMAAEQGQLGMEGLCCPGHHAQLRVQREGLPIMEWIPRWD